MAETVERSDSQTLEGQPNGDQPEGEGEIDYKARAEALEAGRDQDKERITQLENDKRSREKTWMQQQERDRRLIGVEQGLEQSNQLNLALIDALKAGDTTGLPQKAAEIEKEGNAERARLENQNTAEAMLDQIHAGAQGVGLDANASPEYAEVRADYEALKAKANPSLADLVAIAQKAGGVAATANTAKEVKAQLADMETRLNQSEEEKKAAQKKAEEEGFITDTGRTTPAPTPTDHASAARLYNEGKITAAEYAKHR